MRQRFLYRFRGTLTGRHQTIWQETWTLTMADELAGLDAALLAALWGEKVIHEGPLPDGTPEEPPVRARSGTPN